MRVIYLSDVRLGTEASIDAPRAKVLANDLCVEVRVHLHQQSGPTSLLLQEQSIRSAFSIERTTFHEEASALYGKNDVHTVIYHVCSRDGYCYCLTLYILFLSHPSYELIFLCLVAVSQLELKSWLIG